jgi:hypothetical protein
LLELVHRVKFPFNILWWLSSAVWRAGNRKGFSCRPHRSFFLAILTEPPQAWYITYSRQLFGLLVPLSMFDYLVM